MRPNLQCSSVKIFCGSNSLRGPEKTIENLSFSASGAARRPCCGRARSRLASTSFNSATRPDASWTRNTVFTCAANFAWERSSEAAAAGWKSSIPLKARSGVIAVAVARVEQLSRNFRRVLMHQKKDFRLPAFGVGNALTANHLRKFLSGVNQISGSKDFSLSLKTSRSIGLGPGSLVACHLFALENWLPSIARNSQPPGTIVNVTASLLLV
jgi:hypothetical protein